MPLLLKAGEILIPIEVKKKCIKLHKDGVSTEKIYVDYFSNYSNATYNCFRGMLSKWESKVQADEKYLDGGSLGFNYTPTRTTVQVDKNGNVVQAWIKSHTSDDVYLELIDEIRKNTPHKVIKVEKKPHASGMLEINMCDMHFGIADIEHYKSTLNELLLLIKKQRYDEINIIIGQDQFHNDNFNGTTKKGTQVQKVNIPKAWNDAKTFWYNIIDTACEQSNDVKIIYVPGNHDYCLTWAFVQMIKERYQNLIVDDYLNNRKCITYGTNFIGLTHGEFKKSKPSDLRSQFSVKFPIEFAHSKVKEIHCSHLHTEWEKDEYGVMIRRLSTANKEDDWSDEEGYIGANKRFMVFEWSLDKLKSIHYV